MNPDNLTRLFDWRELPPEQVDEMIGETILLVDTLMDKVSQLQETCLVLMGEKKLTFSLIETAGDIDLENYFFVKEYHWALWRLLLDKSKKLH